MEEPRDPNPTPAESASARSELVARLKHHWGLLVAIVVPVVTAATLVIPLVADANSRVTSSQTLVVGTSSDAPAAGRTPSAAAGGGSKGTVASALSSQELEGELASDVNSNANWRVPATAPWKTFPLTSDEDLNSCSDAQVAWLAKYGRRDIADIWNGYLSLSNTATDGSAMSVRNIHSVGAFLKPSSPEVSVYCNLGIGGESSIIPLTQDLGTNHAAVYAGGTGSLEGTPATLNIAPGQYVQIWVDFTRASSHATDDFSGSLVGDVVVGDMTTSTVLFNGFTREGVPGIGSTSLTIYGSTFTCGPTGQDPCTIDQFVSQLKADPGYPN